jgi:hypothetical protein
MSTGLAEQVAETGKGTKKAQKKKAGAIETIARKKDYQARMSPQRLGPGPDPKDKLILLNPGEPGEGEFDLSIQGDLKKLGNCVFALERNVVHAAESLMINDTYVMIEHRDTHLYVKTPVGAFTIRILWPNGIRLFPVS